MATRGLGLTALRTTKPTAQSFAAPRRLLTTSSRPGPSSATNSRLTLFAAGGATGLALYSLWPSAHSSIHADAPTAPPNTGSAAAVVIGQKAGEDDEYHIDASTKLPLARRSSTPVCLGGSTSSSEKPFVLLASGVRTVSFLRVQVYVVALYVDEVAYKRFLSTRPTLATPGAENDTQAFMSSLLSSGQVPCLLRVAPVRNTDFAHLRDGFGRAVQARVKVVRKALHQAQAKTESQLQQPPSEEEEQALADGMQRLRECFPKASLQKGEMLDLVFHPSVGPAAAVDLTLEHGGTVLGSVKHDRRARVDLDVPRLLMEAYVAQKDPVSGVVSTGARWREEQDDGIAKRSTDTRNLPTSPQFKQALTEKLFPTSPSS